MSFGVVLLCLTTVFSGISCSSYYGCLRNPLLCNQPYQYCIDDGITGKCVEKQYSWLVEPQELNGPHRSQVSSNDELLHLTPEKSKRLSNMLLKVKRYLHSNNIELSDLNDKELDELARGIAELFLQQEKELRAKEQRKLEAFLRKLGRDDLFALFTNDRLSSLKQEVLSDSEKSHDQLRSYTNRPHEEKNSAKHRSKPSGRKPMKNSASSQPTTATELIPKDPMQLKSINLVQPLEEDEMQVQVRNGDAAMPSDIRAVKKSNEGVQSESFAEESVSAPNVEFAEKTATKNHRSSKEATYIIVIVVLLVVVLCIVIIAVTVYCMKSAEARKKLLGSSTSQTGDEYQALCRQRFASKANEKIEDKQPLISKASITSAGRFYSPSGHHHPLYSRVSRNSSQSSWSEEPVTSTMDISTGHTVLAYMEDHLNNKDRLDKEWDALCAYRAENVTTMAAANNAARNRSQYAVPYDHNRVKLNVVESPTDGDYINASNIIDNDPRWPVYIATQGPLSSTVHHFWQMIWEQGCVVIVMLAPLIEEGISQCARYWPDEGSSTYNDYEIHLVSEHIWCEDYLVRSLYLKNLNTGETRTVTQFHFLSWPADGIPSCSKQLLELRRKVSKCYRGNAQSPIIVHCSDGCGRTGSYILLDLVIARMVKGTCKEIDIAATLEHLRDQRAGRIVATKEQLEFVLSCVADEVNAILKVLLQ